MNSLVAEIQEARARSVRVSEDSLTVDLVDGRTLVVPLVWYPRLWHGTSKERNHFEIFGDGTYIHWPELDEDISVENLLLGQPSGEGARSFSRWREWYRQKLTEQGASPNGGPATPVRNSGAAEGPPSVS